MFAKPWDPRPGDSQSVLKSGVKSVRALSQILAVVLGDPGDHRRVRGLRLHTGGRPGWPWGMTQIAWVALADDPDEPDDPDGWPRWHGWPWRMTPVDDQDSPDDPDRWPASGRPGRLWRLYKAARRAVQHSWEIESNKAYTSRLKSFKKTEGKKLLEDIWRSIQKSPTAGEILT